ncbi:helix-turn-helix transcriptional regulator [Aquiflexum sp. TKW24L]|uniref:helix-turn-helix transcriptional regulator n=1 Tax=Aquiflexum sp. TKW24L TaxID=2942212 RepID=UPI0020BE603C|nr:helix-turn-helix transcriptional regulator [Aquiflexum sp. TKW24L]MCL6261132.1 helix-turn-helix transcriptional regulator [Aquiflexum sp. TKW24L]
MDISLLEELRNQNKLSEFFSYKNDREFIPHPDEDGLIRDLEKISNSIGMKEGIIIGCFDYRYMSLPFFTENIEDLSGHSAEFLRANGLAGVISALHPEDAKEHVAFNNLFLEVFQQASITEKKTFEQSYTLRWIHKISQKEIWFFTKAKPYLIDEKGNFIYDLHIGLLITNNEHLKGYDWSYSYVRDDGAKVVHQKDTPQRKDLDLSKKEKEVALLLLEGLDSQEIANRMFISINTVFTHRKKILKKMGAKNSNDLMKILISNKLK